MCSKIFLCVTLWEPRLMLRRKKHSTFGFPVNHEACKISNVVMSESQILPFCHSPAISHLWLILLCSIADNNQLKLAITILSHAWYLLRFQDIGFGSILKLERLGWWWFVLINWWNRFVLFSLTLSLSIDHHYIGISHRHICWFT